MCKNNKVKPEAPVLPREMNEIPQQNTNQNKTTKERERERLFHSVVVVCYFSKKKSVSGGGKSTVISLLERFYDIEKGSITIDGTELSDLNVRSWRENVGVVRQEPTLMMGTVMENLKFGYQNATDQQAYKAAQLADAHNFVKELDAG